MKRPVYILAVLLALGTIVGCRVTPSSTASAQIEKWSAANSGRDQFALSELQDLPPWSALYVFAPYTPTQTVNQALGFEWREAKRFNLDMREDIYLAVFVSGSNVVRVEEWRRSKFDCSPGLAGHALAAKTILRVDRSNPVPALTIAEPDGAANRGQPAGSETNPASAAAGPGG